MRAMTEATTASTMGCAPWGRTHLVAPAAAARNVLHDTVVHALLHFTCCADTTPPQIGSTGSAPLS
eukprot:9411440-Lingulodinium_polyedra.AAC.1